MHASLDALRARWRWVAAAAAVIFGAGAGFACGSDSTGPNSQGVANVVMNPDSVDVALGTTTTIGAQPVNAAGKPVSGQTLFWSTSDPSIATVSQSGVVTPVAIGTAIVEASTAGVSPKKPARIVVVATAVASVVVAPAAVTLRVGGTKQLVDTTKDASGQVLTGRTVLWTSSDTSIATSDQAGFVVAHKPGTATITASVGGVSGQSTITVSLIPVASITVAPANPTVILGQSSQLAATLKDSIGNVLSGRTVTWQSSDPTTASVDQTGLVQGVKQGTAKIIATSGVADTVTVTVQPVPINAVLISPQSNNLLVGQNVTLTATVTDGAGNPIAGAVVTFSSNATGIATVTGTGPLTAQVTAIGSGRATITGTSGAKTGTATVTVTQVPVQSVLVTPPVDSITQGHTVQLTATAKDSAGNTLAGRPITWSSSNTGVATVTNNGLVTGVGPGTAAIFATSGGVQGNATVTVRQIPVGSVQISPSNDTVSVNAQRQLTVVVKDSLGSTITNPTVAWTSTNANVAFVNSSGGVFGVNPGTAQIVATSGTKADTNTTVVVQSSVASVVVSPNPANVVIGQTIVVTAASKDGSGNNLLGRTVTWSSANTSTASVSAGGVDPNTQFDTATVTGVATGGPVAVTATSPNSVTGSTQVTVTNVPVAYIIVTPNPLTVNVAFSKQASAQAFDASNTPLAGLTYTWSTKSGGSIASVDGTGNVTGVAAGNDSVVAKAGGKTGGAVVTVSNAPVSSVIVAPPASTITSAPGQQAQLTDTLKDSQGNVLTGRPVTWSSSDNAIAAVSNSGLVTPVGGTNDSGVVTITAKSGTVQGTATVHILIDPVGSVTVTPPANSLTTGATKQLTATVKDAGGTTLAGRPVTWKSSDATIATVSGSGLVTAGVLNDTGTVTITATSAGIDGTASVHVTNPAATSVTVTPTPDTIFADGSVPLTATTSPAGIAVAWTISSAPSGIVGVAPGTGTGTTVSGTATAAGTATITGTAPGGANGSATVVVLGHDATVTLNGVPASLSFTTSPTAQVTATIADQFGTDVSGARAVTWTTSDATIVTVNGGASAIANPATTAVTLQTVNLLGGTVTITATSPEGKTQTATVTAGP